MTDDLLSYRPRTRLVLSEADMARLRDLYYDRDVSMTRIAAAFGLDALPRDRRDGLAAPLGDLPDPHAAAPGGGGGGAAPHPVGSAEPEALFDPQKLALDVAVAARRELAAIGDVSGPMSQSMSLVERKRRADVIASLSRSIQRIDKPFELKAERKQLKW